LSGQNTTITEKDGHFGACTPSTMPVIRPRGLFRIALFALAVSSLAGYGTYLLVLTLLGEGSPLSTVTWDKRGGDVHPFALRKTKHYVEPPEPTGADLAAFDFAKDVAIVYTWVNGTLVGVVPFVVFLTSSPQITRYDL